MKLYTDSWAVIPGFKTTVIGKLVRKTFMEEMWLGHSKLVEDMKTLCTASNHSSKGDFCRRSRQDNHVVIRVNLFPPFIFVNVQ